MENNFASNLKYLRLQSGMTQEKLGKVLGKDYSTIGKWELGQRSPNMEDIICISEYFNISLQDLICRELMTNDFKVVDLNDDKVREMLKRKGLMDSNNYISEENLNKLEKLTDILINFKSE